MKFYIYKIENIVNNKKYIGVTGNIEQRKKTHFNRLRQNKHHSPYLQKAWNKYGEKNFLFQIICELDCSKEEAYKIEEFFIEKEKGYTEGYNGNRGGLEHNGACGKFSEEQIYKILAIHEKFPRSGTTIAKQFNCSRSTISNIYSGRNYKPYFENFKTFTEEQKESLAEDFLEETFFMRDLYPEKKEIRKLNSQQIYMFLYQNEFNIPETKRELLDNFGLNTYSVWQNIREGKSYQKEVFEYNNMSLEEKQQILCHYMETYNRKPLELLGTPTE